MLDDLKMIHTRDTRDLLGFAAKQPDQLLYDYALDAFEMPGITNIVYYDPDTTVVAGLIAQLWPGCQVPLQTIRTDNLPSYVSYTTLFIIAGYVGADLVNQATSVSVIDRASQRGATIIVIAPEGVLADLARSHQYRLLVLPAVVAPRFGVMCIYTALTTVMHAAGLLSSANTEAAGERHGESDRTEEMSSGARADQVFRQIQTFLRSAVQAWLPEVPTSRNPAKQLAQELMGRSIVVTSGPQLFPAAFHWKTGFNQNAKQIAWASQYPELMRDEAIGWTKQPVDKPYAIIEFRSPLDSAMIQHHHENSQRYLSGLRPIPNIVKTQGDGILQELFWTMLYGEYVSLYLALLNGVDPSDASFSHKINQRMDII